MRVFCCYFMWGLDGVYGEGDLFWVVGAGL